MCYESCFNPKKLIWTSQEFMQFTHKNAITNLRRSYYFLISVQVMGIQIYGLYKKMARILGKALI